MLQITQIDYEHIRTEITEYINSLPESERWQDFVGSSGTTIVELIAALASFLSYNASIARQESYIYSARLRTSLVGIANTLGYPVNRNSSAIIRTTFKATYTAIYDKIQPIGLLNNKPLCLPESMHLFKDQVYTVDCLVGEWNSEEFTTTNEPFQKFVIKPIRNDVDNTYVYAYLDEIPVPLKKLPEDATETDLLDLTHPNGLLLVSGDGYLSRQLRKEKLLVDYFIPEDPQSYVDLRLNDLTLVSFERMIPYVAGDTIEKLTQVIAGYRSSYRRGVNIDDHRYISLAFKGLIDAAVRKSVDKCCSIDLSYLKYDLSLMTPMEKEQFIDHVEHHSLVGLGIHVIDPQAVPVPYKATIYTDRNFIGSLADLQERCISIVQVAGHKLGASVKIGELNSELSKVTGVSRVYIKYPLEDFSVEFNQYVVSSIDFTYAIDDRQYDKIGV